MRKITKRDIAILGVFLLAVLVAVGAAIAFQTRGATSAEVALTPGSGESGPSGELAPEGGLFAAIGLIADPRAFQAERVPGGVRIVPTRAGAASVPTRGSAVGGGAPSEPGGASATGPGPRPRGPYGGGSSFGGPQGPGTATVYIAGIAGRGDQLRALVVQKTGGGTRWVSPGESAFGYTLESATARKAVLTKGGARFELELGQGAPAGEAPPAAGPTAGPPSEGPKEAASPDAQAKFVGTWSGTMQGMTVTMTFSAGGHGTMSMSVMPEPMTFTWRLEGTTLKMGMSMGGMSQPEQAVTYRFADDDKTLYLTGPGQPEMRLTRK